MTPEYEPYPRAVDDWQAVAGLFSGMAAFPSKYSPRVSGVSSKSPKLSLALRLPFLKHDFTGKDSLDRDCRRAAQTLRLCCAFGVLF